MPALLPRPNAGKPWTPEEIEALRRFAADGVALDRIAEQLGRSVETVSERARKAGIVLDHARAVLAAARAETSPLDARAGMSAPQAGRVIETLNVPKCYVLVRRGARPPAPWTWEIRQDGHSNAMQSAVRGYRSAEEAWEAGRAALARWLRPKLG